MNIFATSHCPIKSAEALDDLRLNKMIIESAQILSSALWINGQQGPYKLTHKNHPVVQWTSKNYKNYLWVLDHFISLLRERKYRTGKDHACEKYLHDLINLRFKIPVKADIREPFVNCSLFKEHINTIKAYRETMETKWKNDKREPKWTKRGAPSWSSFYIKEFEL